MRKKLLNFPRFLLPCRENVPVSLYTTGSSVDFYGGGIVLTTHDGTEKYISPYVHTPYSVLIITLCSPVVLIVCKHVFGLTTCTNPCSAAHSSTNVSVQITELVAGSLADEVQRVTLRAEGSVNSNNGTFRLEVGSASADDRARSRVDADHDGKVWTSQLGANASADEVGTIAF